MSQVPDLSLLMPAGRDQTAVETQEPVMAITALLELEQGSLNSSLTHQVPPHLCRTSESKLLECVSVIVLRL